MLKEIIVIVAFLISLSGIIAGFSIIQKTAKNQAINVEKIIEEVNADN